MERWRTDGREEESGDEGETLWIRDLRVDFEDLRSILDNLRRNS